MTGRSKSVALVGLGNIGSHLVRHLGRMADAGLGTVALVDSDTYEEKNLSGQDITPDEVGRSKAEAQAERLARLDPGLEVFACHDSVENLPLGLLRADVILAALDSRGARRYVNEAAWRLGVPWIDSGVRTEMLLARVNAYLPGEDVPCYECPLGEDDENALNRRNPCDLDKGRKRSPDAAPPDAAPTDAASPDAAPAGVASTDGISSLGALAASMQAIECLKVLRGDLDHLAAGKRVTVDAMHHRHYVTKFARNRNCRFDHSTWSIERLDRSPADITVGDALALGNGSVMLGGTLGGTGGGAAAGLRVHGKVFVRELVCSACGRGRDILRLEGRLGRHEGPCGFCGGEMTAFGFDALDEITPDVAPGLVLEAPLESVGLAAGDVICVRHASEEAFYELGG